MRYRFNEIFREEEEMLITLYTIKIGPVIIGPGMRFGKGVSFGGINIFEFIGKDIEADEDNGFLIINGFYDEDKKIKKLSMGVPYDADTLLVVKKINEIIDELNRRNDLCKRELKWQNLKDLIK